MIAKKILQGIQMFMAIGLTLVAVYCEMKHAPMDAIFFMLWAIYSTLWAGLFNNQIRRREK